MSRIRRTMTIGLGRAALAGGTAMAAGFVVAADASEGFNQAMNSSLAIMKDVNAEMRADMKRTAFDIARVTKFSGAEAAESYFFLASAGLDAKQSLAALPVVAQFAQAGMFDMARATDLLTDAQSALGKTVKDAGQNLKNMTKLGDQLVKANTLANASVEQFAEALTNKAAAAMRLLNIETSEGIAVLAVFADQGIKGAEAGTAFGIVLRDLTTKAIKNREEFKKLGVNVFDSAGNFQNMADIVLDLEIALFGLSDEQKKMTLLQLGFSDKSVAFTQVLLGMSGAIREYERSIDDAGGTMKRVADSQLTPFAKGMAAVGAAFSEFSVDAATGPMADLGKAMEELAKPGGDLITMLNGIVDAIDFMNTALLKSVKFAVDLKDTIAGGGSPGGGIGKAGADIFGGGATPGPSEFSKQLAKQLAARQQATRERLKLREIASSGKAAPLTQAEKQKEFAEFQAESQILADRHREETVTTILMLQAQAGNQERAKDMEVVAANEKAAQKIRDAFKESPFQEFARQLEKLNQIRGAKGGLTEAEFQRASRDLRKKTIDAIDTTEAKLPPKPLGGILGGMLGGAIGRFARRDRRIEPTAGRIAERGTDAAFQAVLAAMRDDPSAEAAQETAVNTKTAAELLADMVANLVGVDIGGP